MDITELKALEASGHQQLERHPWEQVRVSLLCDWLKNLRVRPERVIDIGCGDGYVLQQLGRRYQGVRLVGVDPHAPEDLPSPPGVEVVRSLQSVPPTVRPAQVVLMMDVLEHVEDPVQLLREVRSVLAPDGFAIITVPAIQALFSQHDTFMGHFRRYSLERLHQDLEGGGFQVLQSGSMFLSLTCVRVVELAAEKLGLRKATTTGLATWSGGPLVSGLITNFLRLDSWFCHQLQRLGWRVPGLSCYALCTVRPGD